MASIPLVYAESLEDSCGGGNHRSYNMNTCYHCNRETSNPKFCSRSCSASETNKKPKRKANKKVCLECGVSVPNRRLKCDDCLKPKDISLEEAIYTKHHRSSAYALVRSRARTSLKEEAQVCEACGYDKHVEVCHVKPIADFPLSTMLSEINNRDNLKLLCPNCHWEFDNIR